jgi:CPA2 family monovalent cation:H+ antiporter-2
MPHASPLITTLVVGFGLAFIFGALAARMKISPLLGYLLAGVVVGPYTPGFVANQAMAQELAEIGVILLMFGVGLHFSWKDLLQVARVSVPGALAQMVGATILGTLLALAMGWNVGQGIVFGLCLSVASTVVLLRTLQEQHAMESERGRISVGWLVVEDIAMVLVLVLLPVFSSSLGGIQQFTAGDWLSGTLDLGFAGTIALTLAKVAAFVVLMMVFGRRAIPWLLHEVAHMGSRELFRLSVLAVALCVAFAAAMLFGVSLALGAFFAGMVLSESTLSQRAAEETLPLRDAFAVLFFVSVGMLFDPMSILRDPGPVFGVLAIIMLGNTAVAYFVVSRLGYSPMLAVLLAAGVGQIGEFSFILVELAGRLEILPQRAHDLVLGGAILSILLNPVAFFVAEQFRPRFKDVGEPPVAVPTDATAVSLDDDEEVMPGEPMQREPIPRTALEGHVVVVGGGVVGSFVAEELKSAVRPFLLIEESDTLTERQRREGVEVLFGNAADSEVLEAANLEQARQLVVTIPQAFEAGQVVRQARTANPDLEIVARAYSDAEATYLTDMGANMVVMGTYEVAKAIVKQLSDSAAVNMQEEMEDFGAYI